MPFDDLVKQLPSLARKSAPLAPFDAMTFLKWTCTTHLSHGELLAARLVLGVWNPDADWVERATKAGYPSPHAASRFDLLEAAGVWDSHHLFALSTWLRGPNRFP